MASSTAQNLAAIVKAVEQHDSSCKEKAKAVALSPYEHDRLGFDSVTVNGRSVPLKTDDSLGTGRFRVICDGYHGPKREEEVQDTVEAPAPAERELVPAGAPSEDDSIFGTINIPKGWKIWSEPVSNDPEADIRAYAERLKSSTGVRPSFLTLEEEMEFYRRVHGAWQCTLCAGTTDSHRPGCPFA